jgi:hypothetical protein
VVRIENDSLRDKILGAWVGKSYGAAVGEPIEFDYAGEIFEGSVAVQEVHLRDWLVNEDDLYMNMGMLKVVVERGLEATSEDFASPYREGGYLVWHANGQARQNLLEGIPAELSGHPYYNPHADDIDFQIECDYIGMISPGLPEAAQALCLRQGRVVNHGDGIYGGMFFTAMYAASFFETDVRRVVELGRRAIPGDSDYGRIIDDVLAWHLDHPDDWRETWRQIEAKWNHDLCPWGPTTKGGKFNIEASFNGAYVALGLLYGGGDFDATIEITDRAGQDTDSNVANAGGIVGTVIGYQRLPQRVRDEMAPYMDRIYNHTDYSIVTATEACVRLARANVLANGGEADGDALLVATQPFRHHRATEVSFPDLAVVDVFPATDPRLQWRGAWTKIERSELLFASDTGGDALIVSFSGNIVYVQGDLRHDKGILEAWVDGELVQERDMYHPPHWERANQATAVWVTGLPDGQHTLEVRVTGRRSARSDGIGIALGRVVSYAGRIDPP